MQLSLFTIHVDYTIEDFLYDTLNATIAKRVDEKASFETVMSDIEAFCGLTRKAGQPMTLTSYEMEKLQTAYDVQFKGLEMDKQTSYELYGSYKPVAITVMHLMNNKSGVDFTSTSHTGVTVGTFAQGVGADKFEGFYDNTFIYDCVADIMDLK